MHPEFATILDMVNSAEYKYGFVSNGWNFGSVYNRLKSSLAGITFSLDGAGSATHDSVRGQGSFKRLMSAVSICVVRGIPFTFNSLITKNNMHKLREIVELASELGGRGLRFGHLIPTPLAVKSSLDLSPDERKVIDAGVKHIVQECTIPVSIAPGFYTSDLFPCEPLKGREVNIDWKGNVSICCHLSGFGDNRNDRDVIGNLGMISFAEAYELSVSLNRRFNNEKVRYFNECDALDTDYFSCWYCLNYFGKLDWLKAFPQNAWYDGLWKDNDKRTEMANDRVKSESKT